MNIGPMKIGLPDEPMGRCPKIIICTNPYSRLGNILYGLGLVFPFAVAIWMGFWFYSADVPLWGYIAVIAVIGLGIVKVLESRAYSKRER